MVIDLPPSVNGHERQLELTGPTIVIGANGSGKSRFTRRMRSELGDRAFTISALHGLFDSDYHDASPVSVETMYASMPLADVYVAPRNQLEMLLRMLLNEEVGLLMQTKLSGHADAPHSKTRLDKLMKVWRAIFPDNEILPVNGKLLLTRGLSSQSSYTPHKLSSGEKAVMYYISAMLFAPKKSVVFVDDPAMFMHPSVAENLWNHLEVLRPDCNLIYTTHDLEFASSRNAGAIIWVRDYDARNVRWDYDILPADKGLTDEIYLAILGSRRPVLFIEGDGVNSIDAKLYPLIFKDFTVKSLGSCNKVIEATRSFNDLKGFHHLDSHGIVDRDRRDATEVAYLRRKGIFVPDVAEIENILMLEEVIRTVASSCGKNEDVVFGKVKKSIMGQFRTDVRRQALLHTRHRVKRTMEYRVDGRFSNINELEDHIDDLVHEINPRALYEKFCREFNDYLRNDDYASVLRVYNQKSMVPGSNVAGVCGLKDRNAYLRRILDLLRADGEPARRIRRAIVRCFGFDVSDDADSDTIVPAKIQADEQEK